MILNKFKFIDLFAGVGGFHQAMTNLGGECVFASEIDKECIVTYKENYRMNADYDITKVDPKDIPYHDVLCGGFPCQAFSKAGKQNGLGETRGTLFYDILRVLEHHKTKYILLENVRNLVSHDKGRTWKIIQNSLRALGYRLTEKPLVLSPHQFKIPQLRERVFIVGIYDPDNVDEVIQLPIKNIIKKDENSIYDVVTSNKVNEKYYISLYEEEVMNIWDEFYNGIEEKVIGFPIWADVFLSNLEIEEEMPDWKKNFIRKNQVLHQNNKEFIDAWLKKHGYLKNLKPTDRKFEWQAGESITSIWEGVIQFRPSGIRVKKPTTFPALVAMVQIPIIGKYKRRLTIGECAKLQSFNENFQFVSSDQQIYKQLGNSVNVKIVQTVVEEMFKL